MTKKKGGRIELYLRFGLVENQNRDGLNHQLAGKVDNLPSVGSGCIAVGLRDKAICKRLQCAAKKY